MRLLATTIHLLLTPFLLLACLAFLLLVPQIRRWMFEPMAYSGPVCEPVVVKRPKR